MKITTQMLVERNACDGQVRLFRRLFGREASVTKANCLKAAGKLSFGWASYRLLPRKARTAYNRDVERAHRAYLRARGPAWADYLKAETAARTAYWQQQRVAGEQSLTRTYYSAVKVVKAEFQKATVSAQAEYNKAVALAFWKASKVKQEKPHA